LIRRLFPEKRCCQQLQVTRGSQQSLDFGKRRDCKIGKYAIIVAALLGSSCSVLALDDGRFGNDPLKNWFDNLSSEKGMCCSFADGLSISDVDWDTTDGHYRVRLHGEWIDVPDTAVVTGPNRYGPAVVWPYMNDGGKIYTRCFLPGACA
jgi:hypothetical protein